MREFPGRRWTDAELGQIVRDLMYEYRVRDARVALRRALVFRRAEEHAAEQLGIFLPDPFTKTQLALRTLTGKLADRAEHMVANLIANPPIIQVNTIATSGRDVTERAARSVGSWERALNGIYYANAEDEQEQIAWSQVIDGVGWIGLWEREAGLGLPERRFFELGELTEEELARRRNGGEITPAPIRKPGGSESYAYAESGDLWMRRRKEDMKQRGLAGVSMFELATMSGGQVYKRSESSRELKLLVTVEAVPAADFGPGSRLAAAAGVSDTGLFLNSKGEIVGGIERGQGAADHNGMRSWWLCRVYSRDEIYYFASATRNWTSGRCIFYTPHDYGEVPWDDAPAFHTDSKRPEEEYLPLLEGAFSVVPGFNQAATLFSNAAAWNAIPRFVIEMPQNTATGALGGGGFVPDPANPSQPLVLSSDSTAGLDPKVMEVIHNGGKIRQLTLEGTDVLLKALEFYATEFADMLPSPVAMGAEGNDGPAWGARILSRNNSAKLKPAVVGHATALGGAFRRAARIGRVRGADWYVLSAPGTTGKERGRRHLIEVSPEDMTDNLSVYQDSNTLEDRLALLEVGSARLERGEIDLRQFYEDYAGELDVDEAIFRKYKQDVINHVIGGIPAPQGSIIAVIAEAARGRLFEHLVQAFPNAAQSLAEQIASANAPPAPGGAPAGVATAEGGPSVAEPMGVRQPGVGMSVQQPRPMGAGAPAPMLPAIG